MHGIVFEHLKKAITLIRKEKKQTIVIIIIFLRCVKQLEKFSLNFNLVPRAFPFWIGSAPTQFKKEKPWERGCLNFSSCNPFPSWPAAAGVAAAKDTCQQPRPQAYTRYASEPSYQPEAWSSRLARRVTSHSIIAEDDWERGCLVNSFSALISWAICNKYGPLILGFPQQKHIF